MRGRQQLRGWLTQQDQTQAWLAERLDVSVAHVSQILSGERRPSLPLSVEIEKLTGIPARDFAEAS